MLCGTSSNYLQFVDEKLATVAKEKWMLNNHLLDAFTQIISMGFSIVKFSHDEKLSKGMMFIMYTSRVDP